MSEGLQLVLTEEPVASTSALPANPSTEADAAETKLSKRQLKKKLKSEEYQAGKAERRAKEKAAKRQRKADRRERIANGEEVEPVQKKVKPNGNSVKPFNAQIIMEMAFDDLMMEKEIKSLHGQIAHCYSTMRGSISPIPIVCTSFSGAMKARMDSIQGHPHERWSGVTFKSQSLENLLQDGELQPENVVYLTADSSNVIETLEEGKAYVIGAIVDKNRHKNLCYNRANTLKVNHGQLPIGTYMAGLVGRRVLTVNHVYEILIKWAETRDWEAALTAVVPKRKLPEKPLSMAPLEADQKVIIEAGESSEEDEVETESKELVNGDSDATRRGEESQPQADSLVGQSEVVKAEADLGEKLAAVAHTVNGADMTVEKQVDAKDI